MTEKELSLIYGGYVNVNSTLINSIVRLITFAYELGRSLGSSLRRGKDKNYC